MEPIAYKSMPTLKFYQNFWNIFSRTQFEVYLLYPVYPQVECRLNVRLLDAFNKRARLQALPSDHVDRMRSLNLPLRLLTEDEIFRLSVWNNPTNETSKGSDLVGHTERTFLEVRP